MTSQRASTDTGAKASLPWLLALALVMFATPAGAHLGHRSYCSVQTAPGGIDVTVQVPLAQLAESTEGGRVGDAEALVLGQAPRLRQELEQHLRATTPLGECRLDASSGPRLEGGAVRRGVFALSFKCPPGPVTLGIDYGFNIDRQAEVVCSIEGRAHVFRPGAADRLVGTPPGLGEMLLGFVALGAEHVFGGLDHVLFVLSLLLGAASAGASEPGRFLRRVSGLVTGFTLGHSATLIVAALGILSLPSRLTESVIALSVVVVAVQNLLAAAPRHRGVTSALFGLIHGFGFASALTDVGLPRRSTIPALLAFNVGIELAQLALVVGCFPLLVWAARRPWFRSRLLVPACVAIAALAGLWLVERAFAGERLPWLGG